MNKYESPDMEVIICSAEDVLRTSGVETEELGENMTPIG